MTPPVTGFLFDQQIETDYFPFPWEYIADTLGGVDKSIRNYTDWAEDVASEYYDFTKAIGAIFP